MRRGSWVSASFFLGCLLVSCGSPEKPKPAPKKTEETKPTPESTPGEKKDPAGIPTKKEPASTPALDPKKAEALGDRWLIILSSKKESGFEPPSIAKLAQNPDLAAEVTRVSSTWFKNLMPCYEVVIAKSFSTQKEASEYSKKLTALGIENYAKNAGKFVGAQPQVEAFCQDESIVDDASCGGLRWVVSREKRSFMRIVLDPETEQRTLENAPAPKALDANYESWLAPLTAKNLGPYSIGQKFTVYGGTTPKSCSIKGFVALTLGTPHFGYLQQAQEEGKPPQGPGCGSEETYAELDCAETEGFAFAETAKQPTIYQLQAKTEDPKLYEMALKALSSGAEYQKALEGATAQAKEKGQELKTIYGLQFFKGPQTVALFSITMQTGEGNNQCGADDVFIEMSALLSWEPGKEPKEVLLPLRELSYGDVFGVLDLEGDGKLELETFKPMDTRGLLKLPEQSEVCELKIDFCDCGC